MRPINGAFESDVDTSDDVAVFVLLGVDDESSFVSSKKNQNSFHCLILYLFVCDSSCFYFSSPFLFSMFILF